MSIQGVGGVHKLVAASRPLLNQAEHCAQRIQHEVLSQPGATWIIAFLLLAQAWIVAQSRNHMPILGCVPYFCMHGLNENLPRSHRGVIADVQGQLQAIDQMDPRTDALFLSGFVQAQYSYFPDNSSAGIVAPSFRTHRHDLFIFGEDLSDETRANYRQLALDHFRANATFLRITPRALELLAQGDGTTIRPTWWILYDAFALAQVVALFYAISARARRRSQRDDVARAIAACRACPTCSYNLKGLATRGARECPECGTPLFIAQATRALP